MLFTVEAWIGLLTVALTVGVYTWWRRSHNIKSVNSIPGPAPLPFFGNALSFKTESEAFYLQMESTCFTYLDSGFCRLLFGPHLTVLLYRAEFLEILFNSSKHITKSVFYSFVEPWLKTGLLTSTGEKWHARRKMITPTFHFKILEDFLEVMNEHVQVLIKILDGKVGSEPFDVQPYLTCCALDIICDTAMARHSNAQLEKDSEYVKAIYGISDYFYRRMKSPWLWPDFIFRLHPVGKGFYRCLKILQDFTRKVINDRSVEFDRQWEKQKERGVGTTSIGAIEPPEGRPIKVGKRMAFLDMLLWAGKNNPSLTHDDIQEEVDTFMFEGHDTTAAASVWAFYYIGKYQEVQAKLQQEVDRVLGYDDRPVTMEDLNQLKYLECFLKESMRLRPPVPAFSRQVCEDCEIGGCFVPKGSTAMVMTVPLHRDPKYFEDPEKFDPDRWLIDNPTDKHPFCYVPFSAGLRNCIGQRFAMMEEKTLISHVLRKFDITCTEPDDISRSGLLILRPSKGIRITLTRRFQ